MTPSSNGPRKNGSDPIPDFMSTISADPGLLKVMSESMWTPRSLTEETRVNTSIANTDWPGRDLILMTC